MGDQSDGSSSAAQSAQEDDGQRRGFFDRFFGTIGSTEDAEPAPPVNGTANGVLHVDMGNLRRMRVDDVAIPTAEIISVPVDISERELVAIFRQSGFSRLPVFSGTLDTPVGMIHLKDLALSRGFNGTSAELDLAKMVRPLLYAPPSMPIGVLLQKMQTARMHMALVIDEYGGVDGLVTIEDLIEQVVGEIADEHDADEDQLWVQEKPGCYIVQARVPLEEFEAEIGRSLEALQVLTSLGEQPDPDTLNVRAFVLVEAGRADEARRALQQVFTVDPGNPEAHQNLARLELRLQRWPEVVTQARAAIELNPQLPLAWNYLGVALYNQRRFDDALDAWQEATALDPGDFDLLYNLAITSAEQGRTELARRSLERFIQAAPRERYAADIVKARARLAELR